MKRRSIIEYRPYEMEPDLFMQTHRDLLWKISSVESNRLHIHNCFEIGLCVEGSGKIRFGDDEQQFRAGDVLFVGRNIAHTTWSDEGSDSSWRYLHVDTEGLFDISTHKEFYALFSECHMILGSREYHWANVLTNDILKEIREKKPEYVACLKGLLQVLFVRLMRIYNGKKDEAVRNDLTVSICPALEYMDRHYMEAFPQELLAEKCYMSPTHFRRKFKELIGTNPLTYLHQVRIMKSCALLRSSNKNVYDIAESVGYASLSCYNRHFTEIMKCPPTVWRNHAGSGQKSMVVSIAGWIEPETSEEIEKHNREDINA